VRRDKSVEERRYKSPTLWGKQSAKTLSAPSGVELSVDRANHRLSIELRNHHLSVLALLGEGEGNMTKRQINRTDMIAFSFKIKLNRVV